MTHTMTHGGRRACAALLLAATMTGCGIENQSAPPLSGPSEFATTVTLTATPDTLVQDGESIAAITANVRDVNGRPVSGMRLTFSAVSSTTLIRSVSFTETTVTTDGNGRATTGLIAPPAPATVPSQEPFITVMATPIGTDAGNAAERAVQVRLLAPAGTPLSNQDPLAVIIADPRVANFDETIRFDASLTTDEGQACGTRCTYIWEFGDDTVAVRGMTAEHKYSTPGTYTATLTVTDDRGGVGTAEVTIRIIGPAAPVANFVVTPASPTQGNAATFNASSSTVGAGGTIAQYAWDFDDGSTSSGTSATVSHTFASAGTYSVTLTVTDSFGRTASRTNVVTVQ